MSDAPDIPLPIPGATETAPDPILASLQTPHAEESVNLGGVTPAPEDLGDTDAEKLARAKPGRKQSRVSKHRTKPELLATAREQEAELIRLRAQLGQTDPTAGPSGPGPLGMSASEVDRALTIGLEQTIELASNVAAATWGPALLVPKAERDILREAWLPIARYYAPRMGAALPWVAALSTTAMVVLPRVNMARELKAGAAPPQAAEPGTDTTRGQGQPAPAPAPMPAPTPTAVSSADRPGEQQVPAMLSSGIERPAYTGEDPVAPPSRVIRPDGQEAKRGR